MTDESRPSASRRQTGVGSATTSVGASATRVEIRTGPARIRHLWTLFRNERVDPEPFYTYLAAEAIDWLSTNGYPLKGLRLLDLGSGPGHYAAALSDAGARVVELEYELAEAVAQGGNRVEKSRLVNGDAVALPFRSSTFDAIFSSNMLEHVAGGPGPVLSEAERVLKPGGWFYLSFTNWLSPWGGHSISPYHYFGPKLGAALYEKRHGEPRKNVPGRDLFPVHIGQVVRLVKSRSELVVRQITPRYYPSLSFICRIPGMREILAWNCLLLLEKRHRPS